MSAIEDSLCFISPILDREKKLITCPQQKSMELNRSVISLATLIGTHNKIHRAVAIGNLCILLAQRHDRPPIEFAYRMIATTGEAILRGDSRESEVIFCEAYHYWKYFDSKRKESLGL